MALDCLLSCIKCPFTICVTTTKCCWSITKNTTLICSKAATCSCNVCAKTTSGSCTLCTKATVCCFDMCESTTTCCCKCCTTLGALCCNGAIWRQIFSFCKCCCRGDDSTDSTVGDLSAAIHFPPLGVYRKCGLGYQFWVCLLLTNIGYLPGIFYAIYVIYGIPGTTDIQAPDAQTMQF